MGVTFGGKHFDSTHGSPSPAIWRLSSADSKTNNTLRVYGCTRTMTFQQLDVENLTVNPTVINISTKKKKNSPWTALQNPPYLWEICYRRYFIKHLIKLNFICLQVSAKVLLLFLCLLFLLFKHASVWPSVCAIAYSGHQCTDKCQ